MARQKTTPRAGGITLWREALDEEREAPRCLVGNVVMHTLPMATSYR
jgi:hypothetical protein